MTNNLAVSQTKAQLTAWPRAKLTELRRYRNAVETTPAGNLVVSELLRPSVAEMDVYYNRLNELNEGMRSDIGAVKRRMARLFLLFPVSAGENTEAVADAYASVLSGIPLWAVDSACKAAIDSGAKFRPSAPELLTVATKSCSGLLEEVSDLTKVLTAEPYRPRPENERDRVKRGFAELLGSLGGNVVGSTPAPFFNAHDETKRDVFADRGPVSLSPGLAASLGIRKREEAA